MTMRTHTVFTYSQALPRPSLVLCFPFEFCFQLWALHSAICCVSLLIFFAETLAWAWSCGLAGFSCGLFFWRFHTPYPHTLPGRVWGMQKGMYPGMV